MFERFKRHDDRGGTGVAERPGTRRTNGTTTVDRRPAGDRRTDMGAVRARQRERYGGLNWGAAFFGWLVAVGLGALLLGLLAAAGVAVGITELSESDTTEIGFGGAIA